MAKKKAKKKTSKKKKASKKKAAPKKKPENENTYLSDEEEDQQEVILVTGEISAGKTYYALTASDFMPNNNKGPIFPAPRRTILKDMFWLQADRKATAGAKGDKLAVETFDFVRHMAKNDCNILSAIDAGVDEAYKFVDRALEQGLYPKLVVDTISKLDEKTINHYRREFEDSANEWAPYKANYFNHIDFYDQLVATGADVIFLCHLKTRRDEDKPDASVVKIASGGKRVPAVIGQSEGVYKRDGVLQIAIHSYSDKVRGKLVTKRRAIFGLNDLGYETKNRYERTLLKVWPDGIQEPVDLGQLLEVARG